MANAGIVAALKAFAIVSANGFGTVWVTVFIAIVYIRLAMVLVVLASSYQAVLEPTPLCVVEF